MTDAPSQSAPKPDAQPASLTFFDRTRGNLRAAWRDIAASARGAVGAAPRPHLPREDAERLKEQMRACLETRGGEVSARAPRAALARRRAGALGPPFLALDATGRRNFLTILARDFDVERAAVDRAVEVFH